jgi:hypothetical protein
MPAVIVHGNPEPAAVGEPSPAEAMGSARPIPPRVPALARRRVNYHADSR